MNKKGLRALGKAMREKEFSDTFGEAVIEKFQNTEIYKNAEAIMIYQSIKSEAPTEKLIEKMLASGKRVFVPVTGGKEILGAEIFSDTRYIKGAFGIPEPECFREVNKKEIDMILVPGLLFSEKGGRLGYGGGYYDRFLSDFSGIKIGLAFDKQLIKAFPLEKHDILMDYILTEKGLIKSEK